MKKKVLSALLTTAMLASMLVGSRACSSRGRQSLQHLLLERGVQEPSDRSLSRI